VRHRSPAVADRSKPFIQATVHQFTDAQMVPAQFSENIHRKNFTPSEALAAKRDLEPQEKAAAKERQ
jgi:hypothetical protein